jgi:hypothetical protein
MWRTVRLGVNATILAAVMAQCRSAPLPVQVDPRLPEQRVGVALQVAEQRSHPPSLDQPAARALLPLAACLVHQVIEVMRAPDSDHRAPG